jgi:hypothetical protein
MIYGPAWYDFMASCRATLGVEAGVSVFDLEDNVRAQCEKLINEKPDISFEELSELLLHEWEDNIFYRTISPRHFEAAAFHVAQILFEGRYSGAMEPMVHYIPLKKDFSNFDEVVKLLKDDALCKEITGNAYKELIASGKYSYASFIRGIDDILLKNGCSPGINTNAPEKVFSLFRRQSAFRYAMAVPSELFQRVFSIETLQKILIKTKTFRHTRIAFINNLAKSLFGNKLDN